MYQILLLFFARDQLRVEFLSDLNYNFTDSHGRSILLALRVVPLKEYHGGKSSKIDKED